MRPGQSCGWAIRLRIVLLKGSDTVVAAAAGRPPFTENGSTGSPRRARATAAGSLQAAGAGMPGF